MWTHVHTHTVRREGCMQWMDTNHDRMDTNSLIPHYIAETNSTQRKVYFYVSQSKT